MNWYFERFDPRGFGATSAAFRNTLSGSGIASAEMLVREAIQNSVDAFDGQAGRKDSAAKPLVVFRRKTLAGEAWERFRDTLLGGEEWGQRGKLALLKDTKIADLLAESRDDLDILIIEDYQTHGLLHHPKSSTSHMRKLLLELGNEEKVLNHRGSGGSFGYGKSVYQVSGSYRIIIAYSHFDPALDDRGASARLLGVAYLDRHEVGGKVFTGKAVFPAAIDDENDWNPIENEKAHDIAERLGFERRREGVYGTSIMILRPLFDMRLLVPAIEKWWWPRLIDDRLDIRIIDDGVKLDPPRPKNKTELASYIRAYNLLRNGDTATTTPSRMLAPIKYGGGVAGHLALYANSPTDADDATDEGDGAAYQEIALFRRPGMVVKYHHVNRLNKGAIGVFQADDAYDDIFKRSENPAHNDWDKNSDRISEDDRKLIGTVFTSIGKHAREFARRATPPPPVSGVRLSVIEQALNSAFKMSNQTGIGGGKQSTDIHITSVKERIVPQGDEAVAQGSFVITLDAAFPNETAIGKIDVVCNLLVTGARTSADRLDIEVTGPDGRLCAYNRDLEGWPVTLKRAEPARWAWASTPFRSDWSVDVEVAASVETKQRPV